jgi:tRNA-2-methylthio-N6-dimethylallyladenosine synthase
MNRTYTIDQYRAVVRRVRERIPEVALSTDVIVGFPGERAEDFERTVALMNEIRYDSAFLFKYSARPDTRAWGWQETVSEEEKGVRLERLIQLQQAISAGCNDAWIGREIEVLAEEPSRRDAGRWFGRSAQFKGVVFEDEHARAGELTRLRVTGATSQTLFARAAVAAAPPAPVPIQIG